VQRLKILITETQRTEGVTKTEDPVGSPQLSIRCLCGAALEQIESGKFRCPEEGIMYVIPVQTALHAHLPGYH